MNYVDENNSFSVINSELNTLASETEKLLQFAKKELKKNSKERIPFNAGTKAILRERGQSARVLGGKTASSAGVMTMTSRDADMGGPGFKIYQDSNPNEIETPVAKLKKKKRNKQMSMSLDTSTLNKTQDLFSQSQPRITVEIVDDASPDNSPREHDFIASQKKKYQTASIDKSALVAQTTENEKHANNLTFTKEKSRILNKDDTFVPAPGVSVQDVDKERQRLQRLENSARAMHLSKEQERENRRRYLQNDHNALLIQKLFRGHLGRNKYSLCSKLRKIEDEEHTNDWIEVQDRESGDAWFYNKRTGISQWSRPDELFHFLPPKKSFDTTKLTQQGDDVVFDGRYYPKNSKVLFYDTHKGKSKLPSEEWTTIEAKQIKTRETINSENEAKILAKEIDKVLGVDSSFSRDKLINLDGHFKPSLKETVANALGETRFDSVSSVLADDRWIDSDKSNFKTKKNEVEIDSDRVDPYRPAIVSIVNVSDERDARITKQFKLEKKKDKYGQQQDLTLLTHEHYGAENPVTLELEKEFKDSQNSRGKTDYMCFGCWSCGSKRTCELHDSGDKIKPSETMLLCRNWEMAVMRRRYRSEEIQEIFLKKTSSIRFDTKRKKFHAVEEQRHIIYKNLLHLLEKENLRLGIIIRSKRWLYSIADQVMIGNVKGKKKEVQEKTALMRLRRTLVNHAQVDKYGTIVVDRHPIPPTTGYSWGERLGQEQYLFTVPDPSTGENVEMILIYPIPVPKHLYKPRVYHLSSPKSIPMPRPEYGFKDHVIPANTFISDMTNVAWFERICATTARDAIASVQFQIKAILPIPGLELLRREKQPPPSSVKFATLGKKPTPQNIDIGGLPSELIIYQLISTYYPAQYGSFMIMEKSIISPGFSPESMISFESILTPPVRSVCVIRPVEHPLNYRRVPTIALHSKIKTELDGKHFYGQNRAEQTGEILPYGFRTTTFSKNLMVYIETDPVAFTPGTDIASLNSPVANKSNVTHADMSYPFCEPSSRDNTSLDFYYLLLEGVSSISFTQIFSALSIQEPGFFLKDMDDSLPMGHLNVTVYRSWSFTQKDTIEEFKSDDGVPYWYHRKTGQTFWQRPLYEVEEKSPLVGGTILDMEHSEEPSKFHAGEFGGQHRYSQGEFRKIQNKHMETNSDAQFRREVVASSVIENRARGTFNKKEAEKPKEVERLDFKDPDDRGDDDETRSNGQATVASQEKPNNGETINPFGWSKSDPNAKEMAKSADAISNPTKVKDIFDTNNAKVEEEQRLKNGYKKPDKVDPSAYNTQLFGEKGQPPAGVDQQMMVQLANKVTEMMSTVMDTGGPNEMIQMGLGMGVALMQAASGNLMGMVNGIVNPPVESAHARRNSMDDDNNRTVEGGQMPAVLEGANNAAQSKSMNGEPIGAVHSTVRFAGNEKLDHSEAEKQAQDRIKEGTSKYTAEDEARHIVITPMPTLTPDVAPPKYLTNELPANAEEGNREKIPILVYPELSTLMPGGVPKKVLDGYSTHEVAGLGESWVLEKDYDKQAFVQGTNLKLNKVVMPLPAGFFNAITKKHIAKAEVDYLPQVPNLPQPKVVGRVKPRSSCLDWLAVGFDPWSAGRNPLGLEYINSLSSKADKLFVGKSASQGLEEMARMRDATTQDAFASIEDVEGAAQQRREVSRQLLLAQDFKRAATLCRHNKYQEIEDLMNQPEWSVPIDYQDEGGNSILHIACQNGNKRLIKLALRRGAFVNIQNLQGQTPLHYAYGYGYDDCGDYLKRKGADDSIMNKDGLTCFEGLGSRELQLL